ncbi:MAG: polyphenol oxidase family protein, partial [Bacillota bacterium]|nr:polyphenol oxidase family protein [Bacillota bacterium]
GVFTADCVPVLLYDKKNDVISAVHSGWKGTLSCISVKALNLMKKEFGTQSENIIAYIGPHIGGCCYEVGKEVQDKFNECKTYDNIEIINNNKLDLEKCIIIQLTNEGVKKGNITSLNLCTFCDNKYELHSYRKGNINYGRMFSFVYLK